MKAAARVSARATCSVSALTRGTASEPERLPSMASASGAGLRSVQALPMTRAASWGMTPTSASAPASACSKSSIARTNASAENARVNVSRAKLRPTRFTAIDARALVLDEDRFAGSAQPNIPPIDLRIAGITSRDQRAEPVGIADGAGQRIVLDRLERGEEHTGLQGLQEPAREDRDADLGRVRLAAWAPERTGHDRLDRITAVGVRRDAAVAVRPGSIAPRGEFAGCVCLPGLEEGIEDGGAGAVEHASSQRDAIAATGEQHRAAITPEQLACEERPDGLGGRGLRHGHTPNGVARGPRSTMSNRYPSATPSTPCSRSRSAIRSLRPASGTLLKIGSMASSGSPGKNICVMSRCA